MGKTGSVLLVCPWYRPSLGGVVEVADRLLHLLNNAGIDTHLLVCGEPELPHKIKAHPEKRNVWLFDIPTAFFHKQNLRTLAGILIRGAMTLLQLNKFMNNFKTHIVVLLYPIDYAWPFLVLRDEIHLVPSLHGNDIIKYETYPPMIRWMLRKLFSVSAAITICGDHLGRKVQELIPGRPLPIYLIPNCVDVNHFTPPPAGFQRNDLRPTLIHVSNFAPKKRTLEIIEAFALPHVPKECRLIMVGDGLEREAATEQANKLGVQHRVEFVGSQKDVRPFLWQSDAFILASEDEGAPLSLLEAMACGIPWISTAYGAAAILPQGECGLVIPSRSPERLAAAISELINNLGRRREMGIRCRQRAEADFSVEKYVREHLELFRKLDGDLH